MILVFTPLTRPFPHPAWCTGIASTKGPTMAKQMIAVAMATEASARLTPENSRRGLLDIRPHRLILGCGRPLA